MIDPDTLRALFSDDDPDDAVVGIDIYGTGQPGFLIDAILALDKPQEPDRKKIERAIGPVLFNVSNYPEEAQAHLIGRDFSRLREALVEALVQAGLG